MELLKECPLVSDSAYTNIVYVAEEQQQTRKVDRKIVKNYIYRVGKVKQNLVLVRYDIDKDEWERLGEVKVKLNALLTLVPIFSGRLLAILGDLTPYLYDTVHKEWLSWELAAGSHPIVPR